MSATALSYSLVTPARDEAANLRRLAASVAAQTVAPARWIVVENGSTDATLAVAEDLAREHPWVRAFSLPGSIEPIRGGEIVRAFLAGVSELDDAPGLVVNLDADVSLDPDFFERLLERFASDPRLGIAGGSAYEFENGVWRQRFLTRSSVWGATRAYRRSCLDAVSPLEERLGWDGMDELKARVLGWRTETFLDLPFRHHRSVGERDGDRRASWSAEGRLAHYMGYRAGYLVVRTLFRALQERDPAALAMAWGYVSAAARREPRWADENGRAYLRREQRLRVLPLRAREALGKRA